jgi:hypothetical protein
MHKNGIGRVGLGRRLRERLGNVAQDLAAKYRACTLNPSPFDAFPFSLEGGLHALKYYGRVTWTELS